MILASVLFGINPELCRRGVGVCRLEGQWRCFGVLVQCHLTPHRMVAEALSFLFTVNPYHSLGASRP